MLGVGLLGSFLFSFYSFLSFEFFFEFQFLVFLWSSTLLVRTRCLLFFSLGRQQFQCGRVACCFVSLGWRHFLCGRVTRVFLAESSTIPVRTCCLDVKEGEKEIAPPPTRRDGESSKLWWCCLSSHFFGWAVGWCCLASSFFGSCCFLSCAL